MLHAVIMAGGSGTRFWPASRANCPKQFLKLGGSRTLIQATFDRISGLVAPERIQVVTNQSLVRLVREQLPELPGSSVLGEPCKRDTAPCVALAAGLALRSDPDAIQVVMPSDHVIQPTAVFQSAMECAARLVEEAPERLVTFGIRPSYPATGFGYIQQDRERPIQVTLPNHTIGDSRTTPPSFSVKQFREKPDLETARRFVESGEFLWNAGIFVWRAATLWQAMETYAPEMLGPIREIVAAADSPDFETVLNEQFPLIQGKSIDYAVMEHYPEVAVIEAPFGWDDVGNWNSLARLVPSDPEGNHVSGNHLSISSQDCVIQTDPAHLVVTAGVKNLIVVQTPDATLIADRDEEELIRQVVPRLQETGRTGLA